MTYAMTAGSGTGTVSPPAALEWDAGARHLVHCPPSWDHWLLDAPSTGEENFVLVDDVPSGHPLFGDGYGHFRDPQTTADTVREIGEFVGYRYFGVPEDRHGSFSRFTMDLTRLDSWRVCPAEKAGCSVRMTTHISARPTEVTGAVPRGLDLKFDVRIDDTLCATGWAGLVFRHLSLPDPPSAARPLCPAEPSAVGRRARENVVVGTHHHSLRRLGADAGTGPDSGTCADSGTGQNKVHTWVLPGPVASVFGNGEGQLSALHLLESLRQTSLLVARRPYGFTVARSVLASCQVHFSDRVPYGRPLRCAAVPGALKRDAEGRPALPVSLTLTQGRRLVAEARTLVVQDF